MEKCDVIIVGGGISGLMAAKTVTDHDPGIRVVLLEANTDLGGRIKSQQVQTVGGLVRLDLGVEGIAENQAYISSLLRELEIKTTPPPPSPSKYTIQFSNRIVRNQTGCFSWFHGLELRRIINIWEKLCSRVCVLDPFGGPGAEQLDEITVSAWLDLNCRLCSTREELQTRTRVCFGAEPGQVSLLFLLFTAATSGGVGKFLFPATLAVEGGTSTIISKLQSSLESRIQILKKQRVISVQHSNSGVLVRTETGEVHMGDRLIVCIPPALQGRIHWSPGLSSHKTFIQNNTPMGHFIKFKMLFSHPYWEKLGLSGHVITSGGRGRSGCQMGPVSMVAPGSLGSPGSAHQTPFLSGETGGTPALQWQTKSDSDLTEAILETLSELHGSWVHRRTGLVVEQWRGTGVSHAVPGTLHAWPAVRTVEGSIHFGGTETATSWAGALEGGVQAGLRAGLEVLRVIRPQSLSREDLEFLSEFGLEKLEQKTVRSRHVYRWTIFLPLTYLVVMYLAIKMRNKYAGLLIPFH